MTRRWRLFPKYALLIITLVGGMLIASGAISIFFSYRDTQAHLVALQVEKAQSAATRIEQFVLDIEHQLSWTAFPSMNSDGNTLEQRRIEYLKLLRQAPPITEVAWLDDAGREQLRVSRLAMDTVSSGTDLSQEIMFREAMDGRIYYGPVYFRKGTEPYMAISRSVGSGGGVTAVEVNLKFVWEVVSRIRIGQAGLAYVIDATGTLIAHPDISLVLKKSNLTSLPQVAALNGRGGEALLLGRNLNGEEVFSAHAPIPTLQWTVFVESPRAEAFAPMYASIVRAGLLLVAGLLFSTVASFFLARTLVRPLQTLKEGAARIGAGELDQRIEFRTGDELEVLAEQFNAMGSQLKTSYAGLERKVEERTAELLELNRTLEQRVVAGAQQLEKVGRLKRFFSPQLADLIVSGGTDDPLKSHRREITVVFLDLRGFTAFAETADPEEVMGVLSEYHAAMGRLILEHEGTLERFSGDGIMIFFNDPVQITDPAPRAARMALAMQREVAYLASGWKKRGYDLLMGVGIAHGFATIGGIGFPGRIDYGAIGTVTNLASRLCGEARGGEILMTQRVMALLNDLFRTEPAGELTLKGFQRAVPAFRLLSA